MRKVNELVREVVAEAVRDLKDPRIGFVTITGAETSPDLRHAVVYYSVLGSDEEKAKGAEALAGARPRIQAALGDQTRLRYTPKLEFRVDAAIDQGLRISQLLAELADEDPTDEDPTGGDSAAPGDPGDGEDDGDEQ